jgi:hypothetical protein
MVSLILLITLCSVLLTGCGDDSPFEPQELTPIEIPNSLSAIHFPTADGSSWTYISPEDGHEYTSEISNTQNIGGLAVRMMENRLNIASDIPLDIPIDHLATLYGFPIHTSFFAKDLDSYTEYAFELWVDFMQDVFFQRNIPQRVLWSFPLYEGKEWIVSKTLAPPEITYTRRIVSSNEILTVPAGTFRDVFYVEEYVTIGDVQTEKELINKYWLARDVGIIRYEYVDAMLNIFTTYELKSYKKG